MPYKFLVGGAWKKSDKKEKVVNPFTGKPFAEVYFAGEKDVREAVDAAHKAFMEAKKLPSHRRSNACREIARGIANRREELGETIALESGKPLIHALGEVDRAVSTFSIAAEEANRVGGEVLPLDITKVSEGRVGITRRFPIGVISGITPFNFPLNLVAHKIAPAIASGNTMVLKPASKTPISAIKLGEIISTTDLPKGAVNIVPCSSRDAKPLIEDERVKMISFTGSAEVGWMLKAKAGKKKVILELGGNAGLIVDEGADLDYAAERCSLGAFYYSGQNCISVQRLYIHEKAYKDFMPRFLDKVRKLKTGDPLDKTTDFSSMVDLDNAKRIEDWIGEAVSNGGRVLVGGKREGAYYPPTVLEGVGRQHKVCRLEAFGPVVVVERFNDFSKALHEVNDSVYGLQAGIFTNNLRHAFQAFEELEVGGVIINDVPTFRVDSMPYGGVKDSGFGREGLKYAIEEMTEIRLMVVNKL